MDSFGAFNVRGHEGTDCWLVFYLDSCVAFVVVLWCRVHTCRITSRRNCLHIASRLSHECILFLRVPCPCRCRNRTSRPYRRNRDKCCDKCPLVNTPLDARHAPSLIVTTRFDRPRISFDGAPIGWSTSSFVWFAFSMWFRPFM